MLHDVLLFSHENVRSMARLIGMKRKLKGLWPVLIILISAASAHAQTNPPQSQEDVQSWNDITLTVPLTKHFDFFLLATGRIGRNLSRINEGRIGLGYVWKPNNALSFSPYWIYIDARNTAGQFRVEQRLHFRASYKFPIERFGLSHRSLFEYRIREGQPDSWRYRPSLTAEKDIPERIIPKAKFFVTEEPFYVSTTNKFSRNRFTAGINKTLNPNLSVDLYYMRQNDGFSRPGDLNVIGTSWRIKL